MQNIDALKQIVNERWPERELPAPFNRFASPNQIIKQMLAVPAVIMAASEVIKYCRETNRVNNIPELLAAALLNQGYQSNGPDKEAHVAFLAECLLAYILQSGIAASTPNIGISNIDQNQGPASFSGSGWQYSRDGSFVTITKKPSRKIPLTPDQAKIVDYFCRVGCDDFRNALQILKISIPRAFRDKFNGKDKRDLFKVLFEKRPDKGRAYWELRGLKKP